MGIPNIKIQGKGRFIESTKNFGEVDDGEFVGSSSNRGVVLNSATFEGTSTNIGSINGPANFSANAVNIGVVQGSALFVDFTVNTGSVSSVTFDGNAINTGIVLGNADFYGQTVNTGTVNGQSTFYGNSVNYRGILNGPILVNDPDPYFFNTSLLLNPTFGDSSNSLFLDNSTNNVIISSSSATQGTFSPFGANDWSTRFNGSNTYISLGTPFVAALSGLGVGKTTIECWVYPTLFSTSGANGTTLFAAYAAVSDASRWYLALMPNASLTAANVKFQYLTSTSAESTVATTSLAVKVSQWNHIVLTIDATTRATSIVEIYINGVKSASTNNNNLTTHTTSYPVNIGGNGYAQNVFNGYISNLRVTKNQVLYTTDFIPSTDRPLTTTSQGASASNVILLTCKDRVRIRNQGSAVIPFTTTGVLSTQPFNHLHNNFSYSPLIVGGSAYFNGSSSLSFNSDSRLAFGIGNFTIDLWIYPTAGAGVILKMGSGTTVYDVGLSLNASFIVTVDFWPQGLATPILRLTSSSNAAPLNTWTHIAIVRSGTGANQTKLYINGIENGTTTQGTAGTLNYNLSATGTGFIGRYNTNGYTGYVSNLRAVKGTALYNAPFNPPSTLSTNISGTSLLLNFANGGMVDRSSNGIILSSITAQVSSSPIKYGTGSVYFNGTNSALITPISSNNFNFGTRNFTVEFWIYPLAYGGSIAGGQIFGTTNGSNANYSINLGETQNRFRIISNASGVWTDNLVINGPNLNEWTHIAVVRNGANLSMYKNGLSAGGITNAAAYNFTGSTAIIGKFQDTTNTRYFRGYLADLRVTTDTARYTTTTFTPPTASLPAHQ